MLNRRVLMKAAGSLPLAWSATASLAQDNAYPSKPVTLVVPFGPGNAADIIGRLIAMHLGNFLGQQVIVENRPGAGGVGAVKMVAAAKPDGHTLLYIGAGVAISQGLFKPQPYDMLASFAPISIASSNDVLLLVRKDSKLTQLEDFIRLAQEKKRNCMVGVSLLGTTQHLCAELFKQRAQVDFTIVPFKTAAAVATALAAGDIDLGFEFVPPTLPLVKSGQLRALAIANGKRSAVLPDVPTVSEQGVAGFSVSSWGMILAPANTPDAVVQRLNRGVQRALEQPDVAKRLADIGVRAPGGTTAQAYELLSSEIVRWRNVITESKISLK
ncbi:tripartite tricarboxylate transporter substrate-binding protein [Acidovorax sp. Be4]|uniref:Tripartite tricarboxylate transporter substrate-binding protein n=1 Tax=Acidovorax bellezanensis TaxID=2976702 RepID=A0ABT2PJG1_9BURK|nr:tripartite tricarboxylate transporter substrate-binding protein [Acidovorax sp. Be4]MCT9810621.1 tripartite tricarboxylate transporter substrate-binding protein [Acidovorax sp. Be4]